jgi:periplasmic protein TonB
VLQAQRLNQPPEIRPYDRAWWVLVAALISTVLHVSLYAFLARPLAAPTDTNRRVTMEIVEPPPPPPPHEHSKSVQALPKPAKLPTPKVVPPPPNQPPSAKAAPPPPIHIGVSLSSTVGSGGFAVPVGNTLAGKPTAAVDANSVAPLPESADTFVPSYSVTEAPEVDVQPDMKAYYPNAARQQNMEGQVLLQLHVDATGRVTHAKLVRGAGNGFDEAAVRAATEKLHFKPARFNGKSVATQIDYKFTFLLD